ncbi:hypothetical protein BD309DRAFT_973270 [Dichomitus squalens]|nr:hypothetical protein BD309DRAFT_973270 [Dichomitus squalens]
MGMGWRASTGSGTRKRKVQEMDERELTRCAHTAWQRNACTLVLGCPHTTTITDRLHPVVVSLSTIASFAMEDLRGKPVW